jgi:hypothetical protein
MFPQNRNANNMISEIRAARPALMGPDLACISLANGANPMGSIIANNTIKALAIS